MQEIKHFIKTHPHMWWGLYLPVYLILYFVVEHVVTDNYWPTQTVIDNYIPFCEYFVIPYDSWGILLFILGVFFIVKDPESFHRHPFLLPGAQRPGPAPGGAAPAEYLHLDPANDLGRR